VHVYVHRVYTQCIRGDPSIRDLKKKLVNLLELFRRVSRGYLKSKKTECYWQILQIGADLSYNVEEYRRESSVAIFFPISNIE